MKLTPRQREVIKKMQVGWDIRIRSDRWELCSIAGKIISLHKGTAKALRHKELIAFSDIYCEMAYYELTQKGKEI